jgi:ribosomal protein S1
MEQDIIKTSSQHKEFQNLLDKDFEKRSVKEGQIIKATVTEITPKFVVCDASLKAEAMIDKSEFKNSRRKQNLRR